MDQIAELLRTASSDPPPTAITVDGLVRRERQTMRVRQVSIAAGVAVFGVLVATVPALSGGGLRPGVGPGVRDSGFGELNPSGAISPSWQPSGGVFPSWQPSGGVFPSWQPSDAAFPGPVLSTIEPTEPVEDAVARLNAALGHALQTVLPAGMSYRDGSTLSMIGGVVPSVGPSGFIGGWGLYAVQYLLSDAAGDGLLYVWLDHQTMATPEGVCGWGTTAQWCEVIALQDGTRVVQEEDASPKGGGGVGVTRALSAFRPDGTHISVEVSNFYYHTWPDHTPTPGETDIVCCRPEPPLTLAQMMDIALAPDMTVFP